MNPIEPSSIRSSGALDGPFVSTVILIGTRPVRYLVVRVAVLSW